MARVSYNRVKNMVKVKNSEKEMFFHPDRAIETANKMLKAAESLKKEPANTWVDVYNN